MTAKIRVKPPGWPDREKMNALKPTPPPPPPPSNYDKNVTIIININSK